MKVDYVYDSSNFFINTELNINIRCEFIDRTFELLPIVRQYEVK